ncbi:MAG: pantetheine-phosphate adenylyltransferase [Mycoplasmataceae bacterium]|nr:pantetheine-phosphate adenylyltransferase [Mycoplasmataceae bacterium]
MKKAIYPGSFDPIHKGHINIIKKASKLFDELLVVVSNNPEKKNQSDIKTRLNAVSKSLEGISNVKVISNNKLLTSELASSLDIKFLVRSGRNDIDFKYEIELAAANKHLNSELETIMFFPDLEDVDYSSTLLRQGAK